MKNLKLLRSNLTKKRNLFRYNCQPVFLNLLFLLTSCTVSLAPKFDQSIVDNLSASTTQIFQLFAEVSEGTSKTDYSSRDEKYNSVIGNCEALELQIKARPLPKNKSVEKIIAKVNERLKATGDSTFISATDTSPSVTALHEVIENLITMKNTDKMQGLTSFEVKTFKGFVTLYLDQALTYEKFLNE